MNIYLVRANTSTENQYPSGAYDAIIMDKLWDFSNHHKVFDLYEDPILEDSVIIIDRDHFMHLVGNMMGYTSDPSSLMLKTPEEHIKVLDRIKSCKNKKIVIIYNYKNFPNLEIDINNYNIGTYPDKWVLVDYLGYETKNIAYVTQTKSDLKIVKDLFGDDIQATYFDRWLDDLLRFQIMQVFTKKKSYLEKNPQVQDKLFCLTIRRYQNSRIEVMCEFITKNLLQDFHYTFAAQGGDLSIGEKKARIFDYINNELPSRYLPYKNQILEWAQGIPYEAKSNEYSLHGDGYDTLFTDRLNDFYNHSKIVVVLETDFYNVHPWQTYGCIITEKTYKAMLYKKPFIILGQPEALQLLKNCGYKTFGHVINESYTTLPTVEERLRAVSDELIRIRNLDPASLQNLLDACQENIEHNYKLLLNESVRRLPENFNIRNLFGNK